MAKLVTSNYKARTQKKRPGVHSKNASKNKRGYKCKYRGQGR